MAEDEPEWFSRFIKENDIKISELKEQIDKLEEYDKDCTNQLFRNFNMITEQCKELSELKEQLGANDGEIGLEREKKVSSHFPSPPSNNSKPPKPTEEIDHDAIPIISYHYKYPNENGGITYDTIYYDSELWKIVEKADLEKLFERGSESYYIWGYKESIERKEYFEFKEKYLGDEKE